MRRLLSLVGMVAALFTGVAVLTAPAALASPVQLLLPQSTAFAVLGHSCGGIQEKAFATGFDATSGYPTGDVYLSTSCGGSGRGGGYQTTIYSAWVAVTWDFTGAVVTYSQLSTAPTVDPSFVAYDAYGNEVYNQSNNAYLVLAPGFVPAPRLTGLSVSSGPAAGGTTVTISGTGFTGATAVDFGATPAASLTVSSDTSITAVSPQAPAGTVDVTVTNPGGTSATGASDQFTFVDAPSVLSVSPDNGTGAGGTAVTITGAHFSGATTVGFGGNAASFTVNSDTTITAVSPPGEAPDTVDVTVTSVGGTSAPSAADQFTYTAPTVAAVSPSSGPFTGGTPVTISGAHFTGTTAVDFGGTAATSFTVNSDTSITAISPSHALGTVDVTVTAYGVTSPTSPSDQFSYNLI